MTDIGPFLIALAIIAGFTIGMLVVEGVLNWLRSAGEIDSTIEDWRDE